jgi:hypothetical protein
MKLCFFFVLENELAILKPMKIFLNYDIESVIEAMQYFFACYNGGNFGNIILI